MEICEPDQLHCVKDISVDHNDCLHSCDGLFITGFDKSLFEETGQESFLTTLTKYYSRVSNGNKSLNFADCDTFGNCQYGFTGISTTYIHIYLFICDETAQ